MKKALAIAISLAASSSAFANSADLVNSVTSAPLNIKFSDLTQSGNPYCMYSTVISTDECSQQVITCSGNDEFVYSTELAASQRSYNLLKVKNEQTQEIVAEGYVTYSFDVREPAFKISQKHGLDNMNYYHTDQGIEFFLKPAPTESVILFTEEEYIGKQLEVISDQADLGHFNADVDSFTIPDNWTLRFYEGKNFKGNYYTRGEMRNGIFDSNDFGPRIQSIRVVKEGESLDVLREEDRQLVAGERAGSTQRSRSNNDFILLYTEENYTGHTLQLVEDLSDLGPFNADIDSYTIPQGWTMRFYEGKNYQGGYYTRGAMRNGIYDARDFEPRVQSIRIVKAGESLEVLREEDRNK